MAKTRVTRFLLPSALGLAACRFEAYPLYGILRIQTRLYTRGERFANAINGERYRSQFSSVLFSSLQCSVQCSVQFSSVQLESINRASFIVPRPLSLHYFKLNILLLCYTRSPQTGTLCAAWREHCFPLTSKKRTNIVDRGVTRPLDPITSPQYNPNFSYASTR